MRPSLLTASVLATGLLHHSCTNVNAALPPIRHIFLTPRGGDGTHQSTNVISNNNNNANASPPSQQLDLATWSRMRIQSDPSSIPMAALLSKRYLDVPLKSNNSNDSNNSNNNNLQPLGLTPQQRSHRLTIYGRNELQQPPERSLLSFVIEQFDDKLVRILLVVALASGLLGLLELKDEMMAFWRKIMMTSSSSFASLKDDVKESKESIVQAVVEEAKARILGEDTASSASSTVSSNMNSIPVTTNTQTTFGWTHILEAMVEPIVISTILVINALVGGYQSLNASKGISALKKMQANKAVLRLYNTQQSSSSNNNNNNQDTTTNSESSVSMEEVEVDAATLVPGDIVVLSVGQKIPADIRLISISTSTFTVDEASLTGESDSVQKIPYIGDIVLDEEKDHGQHTGHVIDDLDEIQEGVGSMGKHANGMLYSGTVITAGKGVGVVVRTAMSTEMGKIQKGVTEAASDENAHRTPLAIKLDEFGNTLTIAIGVICVVVWVASIPKFYDPSFKSPVEGAVYYAKVAVALGVAAIPEGLPAVITLCLSLGTRRMAKRNVIVRKLQSVETLGCTSVICT
eukprot:scaffold249350_cov82-Cyclotella_meneghiniana.AAC.1